MMKSGTILPQVGYDFKKTVVSWDDAHKKRQRAVRVRLYGILRSSSEGMAESHNPANLLVQDLTIVF